MLNYKIFLKFLELKLDLSKKFYEEILSKIQENKSILEKRYEEEEVDEEKFDDLLDNTADDYAEQEELENLARMLIISHNYFILEHLLKSLLGRLQKEGKITKRQDYRKMNMPQIKDSFKEIDIDFDHIEGFKDCDILRLLVNSIKHNGARVSEELAEAKSSYKENEDVKILPDEVDKYSDVIKLFCGNLISCLITIN